MMESMKSKYMASVKRSKSAYINALNTRKIKQSKTQLNQRKHKNPSKPCKQYTEIKNEYEKNIKTITVFINNIKTLPYQISIKNLKIKNNEEYDTIFSQCKNKILNDSINTREEDLKSFEELEDQQKQTWTLQQKYKNS